MRCRAVVDYSGTVMSEQARAYAFTFTADF